MVGNGSNIINQIPAEKESLLAGEKVVLKTDGELTAPDMTGWSLRDVMKVAEVADLKLNSVGNGYVVKQNIKAGSPMKEGEFLIVDLDRPSEKKEPTKEDEESKDRNKGQRLMMRLTSDSLFYNKSTSIYLNEPYSKEEVRSFMRVSNVTVRKRLTIVLLVGIFIFFIIDVRLGYVQLILGEGLQKKQKDLWSRNIPFEPKRGEIVDRNGVALATNISAPTVYVVPSQIKNPAEAAEKLASVLNMSKEKAYRFNYKKD